jgi:hypothetical protein
LPNIYKKQHGAQPCVEKMQFIFFVPPNEELEGTLHPQKFGCTPKNEGKRVHVPPDEKTCGHTDTVDTLYFQPKMDFFYRTFFFFGYILTVNTSSHVPVLNFDKKIV